MIPSLGPNRFWGRMPLPESGRTVIDKLDPVGGGGSSTHVTMRLYDPIDSYGGEFGVSAKEFAKVLDGLDEKVDEIRLHINSPGGEVFEGIAIANSLRNHQARVVAHIDGIAASSASFIAASADEVIAGRNSQMMIHDAMGLAVGNAKTMADMAGVLDKISGNIASFYAEKTGAPVEDWRAAMQAETWYTADEAVDAGLADSVEEKPETDEGAATNRFDLSIFNYAGRENAPAPKPPSASAVGSTPSEGGPLMSFTDDLRKRLGVAEDADEATIVAALDEALAERADPSASPPTPPATPPAAVETAAVGSPPPAGPSKPGTMVIDSSAWDAQQERIQRLEAADVKRRREERDQVIAAAVTEGKFHQDRSEHWARLWDADPEGTRQILDGLTRFVVPVNELGHGGGDDGSSVDDEFAHMFPPAYTPNGA